MKKRRKKKPGGKKRRDQNLIERFQSTCGWCGRRIPPDAEVFGGGGKARPGFDLSPHAGTVLPIYMAGVGKTVLVAVAAMDSEAKRDGQDFMYLTCSEACGIALKTALDGEIALGDRIRSEFS